MSRDTWTIRDYPILCAVADELEETGGGAFLPQDFDGYDRKAWTSALLALIPSHIEGEVEQALAGPPDFIITGLTERGRRAAGLWPAEDSHTETLVAAILAAAEQVDDEDERGRLRKAADALAKGTGRVLEGAVAAVIAGAIGGQL